MARIGPSSGTSAWGEPDGAVDSWATAAPSARTLAVRTVRAGQDEDCRVDACAHASRGQGPPALDAQGD